MLKISDGTDSYAATSFKRYRKCFDFLIPINTLFFKDHFIQQSGYQRYFPISISLSEKRSFTMLRISLSREYTKTGSFLVPQKIEGSKEIKK